MSRSTKLKPIKLKANKPDFGADRSSALAESLFFRVKGFHLSIKINSDNENEIKRNFNN